MTSLYGQRRWRRICHFGFPYREPAVGASRWEGNGQSDSWVGFVKAKVSNETRFPPLRDRTCWSLKWLPFGEVSRVVPRILFVPEIGLWSQGFCFYTRKKLSFCALSESFTPTSHYENPEIHKVFRNFHSSIRSKIFCSSHQKIISYG